MEVSWNLNECTHMHSVQRCQTNSILYQMQPRVFETKHILFNKACLTVAALCQSFGVISVLKEWDKSKTWCASGEEFQGWRGCPLLSPSRPSRTRHFRTKRPGKGRMERFENFVRNICCRIFLKREFHQDFKSAFKIVLRPLYKKLRGFDWGC